MIFPSHRRKARYINNNLYIIHAVIPIDRVKSAPLIKEWLGVDTAFKVQREGTYWFCEEIKEIDWEDV